MQPIVVHLQQTTKRNQHQKQYPNALCSSWELQELGEATELVDERNICLLLAKVGLPILERLLDGNQLPGLQGVQILAFQMPAPCQGKGYPNHNMNIHASSKLVEVHTAQAARNWKEN